MKKRIRDKLKHYYLDNRSSLLDGFVLILAIVISAWFIHTFQAGELMYDFTREHESLDLDEIILVAILFCVYLSIFTFRRYLELRRMVMKAHTDSMLGIMNRGRGSELIRRELKHLEQKSRPSSLVMFDIDNFKYVNDTYGHDKGDVVLREIATTIMREIRETDELIRWGGEEFLILCSGISLEEGVEMAERLRNAIEEQRFDFMPKVTASFGVTTLAAGQPLREQIARVDENLYTSKQRGRNIVTGR